MTIERHDHLPDPSREAVHTWLQRLSLGYLHDAGWEEVNRRAHALAMGGRKFANENFADNADAKEGFYAGLTYGLLGNAHFGDIKRLAEILSAEEGSLQLSERPELVEKPQSDAQTTDGGDDVEFPPHAA